MFVFIDESGNFDFSERGTRHFVISAFITANPISCGKRLQELTYEFLAVSDSDQIPFHATENSSSTRDRFISGMCKERHYCRTITVWLDKSTLVEDERFPEVLYARLAAELGKLIGEYRSTKGRHLVFLFDKSLTKRQQGPTTKALKRELAKTTSKLSIKFRPVSHDVNGQIADYYAWSTFRKLERGDSTWLVKLPGPHRIESAT